MQKIILFCLFISIRIGLTAQSLFSDADITSKTINTSLAIGIISGGAAVTNGGDATYNIPISIPSGLNGMNPGIKLCCFYRSSRLRLVIKCLLIYRLRY